MKLKHLLAFVGACAALNLVACSDDSSTSGDYVESYSVVNFDEQNRSFSFYTENKDDYCVLDEATKSASWETIDEGNDTVTMVYNFVTLPMEVVRFITDSLRISVDGNTAMNLKFKGGATVGLYVGGDASSAKGTWVSVPCDMYDTDVRCFIRDEWRKVTLSISSSTIKAEVEYVYRDDDDYEYDYDYDYDDDYYTDDVSKSSFIASLYETLSGAYTYIRTGYSAFEDRASNIEYLKQVYGIEVQSSSKSSQTFVINNKTYELKAREFELGEDEMLSMDISLTSGDKTCHLSVEQGYLDDYESSNKSACRDDLYEYYRTEKVTDYMGNNYRYAYEYKRDNSSEFETCVGEMAGVSSGVPYLKQTAPNKSEAEFWREYNYRVWKVLNMFK